jgi:hypothetical protein
MFYVTEDNNYIYTTCEKRQINVNNETLITKVNCHRKFNYSPHLEEHQRCNEKSGLIFSNVSNQLWPQTSENNIYKKKTKGYLLLDNGYENMKTIQL